MKKPIEWTLLGIGFGAGVAIVFVASIWGLLIESQNGNGVAIAGLMILCVVVGVGLTLITIAAFNFMNMKQDAMLVKQMRDNDMTRKGSAQATFSEERAMEATYKKMMAELKAMQEAKNLLPGGRPTYGLDSPAEIFQDLN